MNAAARSAGFGNLLRAEWVKLRSVPRWTLGVGLAIALTVGLGVLGASESGTDANTNPDFVVSHDGKAVVDNFRFVHQPMTGDGSIVAHVVDQDPTPAKAAAGIVIKQGATSGAAYAALTISPADGVRLRANFHAGGPARPGTAPRWLKLTRSGSTVTGYESDDGLSWRRVGTVQVPGLQQTAEVGLLVSSPTRIRVVREAGGTSVSAFPTTSTATFDHVRVEAGGVPKHETWTGEDIGGGLLLKSGQSLPGSSELSDGRFTVTGSGEVGPRQSDDDVVQIALMGVLFGIIAIVAVGALFMTSEYKRGLIRTTFTARPQRGWVLAAKAIVLGVVAFVAGLVASVASLLLALPRLYDNGYAPPAYPQPSFTDPLVWRALIGTALFVAAVALLSLALGAVVRHGVAAITVVLTLLILPIIVSAFLPLSPAVWLMRLTPAGGFAVQRVQPPTALAAEAWSGVSPGVGLGVAAAYAGVALLAAYWLLRRRDA